MPRPRSTDTANYQVRALQRGLQILQLLATSDRALGLGDISQQVDVPKSTALRLLDCLRAERFLEAEADGLYSLGLAVFQLTSGGGLLASLERLARPYLQQLVDQTHQTANFGVLDRTQMVHLAVVEPARPLRYHTRVGTREPLHCTGLGKVLASALDEAALTNVIETEGLSTWTPATITDPAAFRRELRLIRRLGFAEDREEATPGLRCLAAPVRDNTGRVVGALSIAGPAAEFTGSRRGRLLPLVLEAAAGLSERLGWSSPSARPQSETASSSGRAHSIKGAP